MKKLAFVINVFREDDFHSGGEKLFFELVNRAIQDGHAIDLYCTTYLSRQNILKNRLNRLVFLGHPKDFKYPKKIEAFYKKVKNLTEQENYDFIVSENIAPPLDIGVLQGHSLVHYRRKAGLWFGLMKHNHINAQKKWMKDQYRKIIVPSKILKNELIENFNIPEDKFIVIYPGVDKPESTSTQTNGIFTFGLSAPSFGKKGGYMFLKALKQLKDRNHIFRAKIIYPKYKKNLKLRFFLWKYGLQKYIEFLPYQASMHNFYNSINCVVMPSYLETFGLVALEGMINKIPAIVSHYCGASEIITDSENGFVCNEENLAEKMAFILSNRTAYERISQNAYETALTHNWERFYQQFKQSI